MGQLALVACGALCIILLYRNTLLRNKLAKPSQQTCQDIQLIVMLALALCGHLRTQKELDLLFEPLLRDMPDEAELFAADIRRVYELFGHCYALAQDLRPSPNSPQRGWTAVREECVELAEVSTEAVNMLSNVYAALSAEKQRLATTPQSKRRRASNAQAVRRQRPSEPKPKLPFTDLSGECEQLRQVIATLRDRLKASRHPRKAQLLKELAACETRIDTFALDNLQGKISPQEKEARMRAFLAPLIIKTDQILQEEAKKPLQ